MRLVVLLLSFAIVSHAHAKSGDAEGVGLATIEKGDVGGARSRALAQALTDATAKVAGQYVESLFKDYASEISDGQKSSFRQKVEQSVRTDTQGYVQTYKLLEDVRDGDNYRIKVLATINTNKIDDFRSQLKDELATKKRRALVVTRELDVTSATPTPIDGQTGAFIEHELTKAGLEIVAHSVSNKDADLLSLCDRDGKQSGADIVVLIDAKYKNLGVYGDDAPFDALKGQTRVSLDLTLRSAIVSQRRVLSSKPVSMSSNGLNYGAAVKRMVAGGGNNAVKQVTEDFFKELLAELQKAPAVAATPAPTQAPPVSTNVSATVVMPSAPPTTPSGLRLVIEKVKSFKKLGMPLIALIGKARGVKTVAQKGYEGEKLELDVEFSGDPAALESFIFKECTKKKFCKTIDKKSSAPNELVLTMFP